MSRAFLDRDVPPFPMERKFDPDLRLISEVLRCESRYQDRITVNLERVRAWEDMLERARRRASDPDGGHYE
jgi:hypothetical protein